MIYEIGDKAWYVGPNGDEMKEVEILDVAPFSSKGEFAEHRYFVNFIKEEDWGWVLSESMRPSKDQRTITDTYEKLKKDPIYLLLPTIIGSNVVLARFGEIIEKTNEIYDTLGISRAVSKEMQLVNAYKLSKYIIEHAEFDEDALNEVYEEFIERSDGLLEAPDKDSKLDMELHITQIHRVLCDKKCTGAGSALALAFLMKNCGMNAGCAVIGREDDVASMKQVAIAGIGGVDIIFDPHTTREAIRNREFKGVNFKNFGYKLDTYFKDIAPGEDILDVYMSKDIDEIDLML